MSNRVFRVSPKQSSALLAGCTVVITRPPGAASGFVRRTHALGGDAIALPGLSLRAVRDTENARSALVEAAASEAWIFTSPAAVRFAFLVMPALQILPTVCVCAVGTGTQRALARHQVTATAPRLEQDSEGLLALPELTHIRGARIALIGAAGGRGVIAPALRQRGAVVTAIHVYERTTPRWNRRHFDALTRAPDPLITLLSSGEALANLAARLPAPLLVRLRGQTLVVSSARLAKQAREAGFGIVFQATSAHAGDLISTAAVTLARHRL